MSSNSILVNHEALLTLLRELTDRQLSALSEEAQYAAELLRDAAHHPKKETEFDVTHLRGRLNLARYALQYPERVQPPPPAPLIPLSELPDGHHVVTLYSHWHPTGKSVFGELIADERGEIKGFIAQNYPEYGADVRALKLEEALKTLYGKIEFKRAILR